MSIEVKKPIWANAFVSCSLRVEDKPFIDLVEGLLHQHNVKPVGTVGKYSAAPTNLAEHMKQNIPLADFIVIVATPRYLQHDVHTGKANYGVSEMLHVETGMAFMANKPVLVFVKEGTTIGSFLPNITQYITLNGRDHSQKSALIRSLFINTYNVVTQNRKQQSSSEVGDLIKTGLAVWGGISILDYFLDDDPPSKKTYTKTYTRKKKSTSRGSTKRKAKRY
jgi:hypothetical protein